MTSVRSVESATTLRARYGPVVSLRNVGTSDRSTGLFKELVGTPAYRAQVLHHAATLGVNNVLFVVGTGGSITKGGIVYVCHIVFAEHMRHNYTYALDCVRTAAFKWVGEGSERVPEQYDALLQNTHASDLYSFVSYYGLSQAIRHEVITRGEPIPPARMIRLTPAVYWNNPKGGVDVISRYVKTLARSNMSECPVVSIIARLLSMQVNNAAVAYRLHKAESLKLLPTVQEVSSLPTRGYSALRHKVTQCESFGFFARQLAKEWVDTFHAKQDDEFGTEEEIESESIKPMFRRKAADRYNIGTHKARRLNRRIVHKKVSGTSTYCVLCSWSLRGMKDGKMKVKRKGSRQVQLCGTCKQAICTACWSEWHSRDTLKRTRPTAAEKRLFDQSLRSVRRRCGN
ncbi:unnamed protein product [Chondrus crispus]|uniref:Uncharacterized protein n=1 Tax=Chondrus crispus TaxID=2769 RepID=R7Q7A3_CHOCR|nr:unnamed protein product [Chondrus crispus]CDF34407.1 unnamed protein product [Chondrus crispus]|eukprot:XP_005714226.1 unnamed protein product [Chondrus crispus]